MPTKTQDLYKNIYGLTGIIGSGKTSVAELFRSMGAYVIHADELSRQVLSPEHERYEHTVHQLKKKLSSEISSKKLQTIFCEKTKEINRKSLGEIVFSNEKCLKILENLIHPEIRRSLENLLQKRERDRLVIYEIPLLFEKGLHKRVKASILVYAPEKVAVDRAHLRTGLTKKEIRKRLRAQISTEEKKKLADYIINNTGGLHSLMLETKTLWQKILKREESENGSGS